MNYFHNFQDISNNVEKREHSIPATLQGFFCILASASVPTLLLVILSEKMQTNNFSEGKKDQKETQRRVHT